MGALPKKKLSKARTRSRRSKFVAKIPALTKCPNCGEPALPHQVCVACGFFRGREIVKTHSN